MSRKLRTPADYWMGRAEAAEAALGSIATLDTNIPLGQNPTIEFYRDRLSRAIRIAAHALNAKQQSAALDTSLSKEKP